MSDVIEEAEAVVAAEVAAMQLNPDFSDLCVVMTHRVRGLHALFDEFVASFAEACRIIEGFPEQGDDER